VYPVALLEFANDERGGRAAGDVASAIPRTNPSANRAVKLAALLPDGTNRSVLGDASRPPLKHSKWTVVRTKPAESILGFAHRTGSAAHNPGLR